MPKTMETYYRYTGADGCIGCDLSELCCIYYGTLEYAAGADPEENDPNLLFIPVLLSGSDFGGDAVSLSNYRSWLEMHEQTAGKEWWNLHGGYGSYGVAIRANCGNPEIIGTLRALENYPVLDDDHLGELENELYQSAWKSWAESDLQSSIEKNLSITIENGDLWELFYNKQDEIGEYWTIETGAQAWIRIDPLADSISIEDLDQFGIDYTRDRAQVSAGAQGGIQ